MALCRPPGETFLTLHAMFTVMKSATRGRTRSQPSPPIVATQTLAQASNQEAIRRAELMRGTLPGDTGEPADAGPAGAAPGSTTHAAGPTVPQQPLGQSNSRRPSKAPPPLLREPAERKHNWLDALRHKAERKPRLLQPTHAPDANGGGADENADGGQDDDARRFKV